MREKFSRLTKTDQSLTVILVISVLLRVAAVFYIGDTVEVLPGTYDQISYHNLATRVINGHGFTFGERWWPITAANAPTAHWSYLYTFYLATSYTLFGQHPLVARLIQAVVVGTLQPTLVYLLGRRIFGELAGLITAGLTCIYVYFIYYAATLMTEPFYITAILGALYLSIRMVDHATGPDSQYTWKSSAVLGVKLGLTLGVVVLFRQLFMLMVPFIFLWIWWAARDRGGRKTLPTLLLSGALIAAMVTPLSIYNYTRFDRFVLLNTNAGYAFFWGNHPVYGTHFEPILPPEMGSYQSLIPPELRHLDEAALDQALLKRGISFITQDPIRYVQLSLSRIPAYFMFWPSPKSSLISNISRVASFGLFLPFMVYGLILTLLNKHQDGLLTAGSTQALPPAKASKIKFSSPLFLIYTFLFIYTGIHILTWALIRYRLPVDAVLLMFAGLALVDLIQRLRKPDWFTKNNL